MSVGPNGFAFRVPGHPDFVKMLMHTVLPRAAFDGWEYYDRLIDSGTGALWCIVGYGFCLFSVRYFGSLAVRELVFHASQGVSMVHPQRMRLLFDLARAEKCDGIFVHTPNKRIQRWLLRWGFMELVTPGDFRWVFKDDGLRRNGMVEPEMAGA